MSFLPQEGTLLCDQFISLLNSHHHRYKIYLTDSHRNIHNWSNVSKFYSHYIQIHLPNSRFRLRFIYFTPDQVTIVWSTNKTKMTENHGTMINNLHSLTGWQTLWRLCCVPFTLEVGIWNWECHQIELSLFQLLGAFVSNCCC